MQIKFDGWKLWAAQAVFTLLTGGLLTCFFGSYYRENPQFITKLLFCLSVMVFMTALPFIYRSVRYRMQEIEAATYFSSVKLLAANLAVTAFGNLAMLAGIGITAAVKTPLSADSAALYLCVPFLLASSAGLFMLGHFTAKQFISGSIGVCAFMILVFAIISGHCEPLFQQSFSMGWVMVCGLLAVFCVHQFRYILYRSSYAEMQTV